MHYLKKHLFLFVAMLSGIVFTFNVLPYDMDDIFPALQEAFHRVSSSFNRMF